MRKRSTRKSISLGGQPSFKWQLQGDSEGDEPELLAAPPTQSSRRRWRFLALYALLILPFAYWLGQQLVQRANSNLAQVEMEVARSLELAGSLPQAPQLTPDAPSGTVTFDTIDPGVTLLELYGDLALVEILINNPAEAWHSEPYRIARVMQEKEGRWQVVAPVNIFWSDTRTLDTTYFHLEYSARDHAAVREVSATIDELYRQLHHDLGLPVGRERINIRIAAIEGSNVRVTDLRYSGSTLIVPPPDLIARPLQISDGETLRQALMYPLSMKVFDQIYDEYPVACDWREVREGIGLWLRWQGHTLPSRRHWEYESLINAWSKPTTLPRLNDLIATPRECWPQPTSFEIEVVNGGGHVPRAELASTLIEYIVATYGREMLPALLHAIGEHSDWESVAQSLVNLSAEELEAGWQDYLLARPP